MFSFLTDRSRTTIQEMIFFFQVSNREKDLKVSSGKWGKNGKVVHHVSIVISFKSFSGQLSIK